MIESLLETELLTLDVGKAAFADGIDGKKLENLTTYFPHRIIENNGILVFQRKKNSFRCDQHWTFMPKEFN